MLNSSGEDIRFAVGPGAEPEHRIVVRPRVPALLHPRLRQHRLPPERVAAGLAGLRRRRAGEPDPEGLPDLRHAADRGARRAAGHAVRPQHAGRRREGRFGRAVAEARGLLQRERRALQYRQLRGRAATCRCRARSRRGCRCSRSTATTTSRTRRRTRRTSKLDGYDDNAARLQVLFKPTATFQRAVQRPRPRARRHRRGCSARTSSSRASNDFANDFNPRQVYFDGQNQQRLESNGANLRLRWDFGPLALNSISAYEHVQLVQPRGYRRRLWCVVCTTVRARASFRSPTRRPTRCTGHEQLTPGTAARVDRLGSAEVPGRPVPTSTRTT